MASPSTSSSWFDYAKLKNQLKKYGRTGIVTYLGISGCVTAGCYFALEQHVDLPKMLGIKASDEQQEASWMESMLAAKGSKLALAMLCSKVFVPLKLPLAIALTPYVHRLQGRLLKYFASIDKVKR